MKFGERSKLLIAKGIVPSEKSLRQGIIKANCALERMHSTIQHFSYKQTEQDKLFVAKMLNEAYALQDWVYEMEELLDEHYNKSTDV